MTSTKITTTSLIFIYVVSQSISIGKRRGKKFVKKRLDTLAGIKGTGVEVDQEIKVGIGRDLELDQ